MTIHDASAPNPKGQPTNDSGSAGSFWMEKNGVSWMRDDWFDWYWWLNIDDGGDGDGDDDDDDENDDENDATITMMKLIIQWWNLLQHHTLSILYNLASALLSLTLNNSASCAPKMSCRCPRCSWNFSKRYNIEPPQVSGKQHTTPRRFELLQIQCSNISRTRFQHVRLKHLCVFGLPFGWQTYDHPTITKHLWRITISEVKIKGTILANIQDTKWHVTATTACHCQLMAWNHLINHLTT